MTNTNARFTVAVYPGDGIGAEIMGTTRRVLDAAQSLVGGFELDLTEYACGAGLYRDTRHRNIRS